MKKVFCRILAMGLLATWLSAVAQSSGGEMKSDDNMKQDTMKKN